jgi:hypothetical protein
MLAVTSIAVEAQETEPAATEAELADMEPAVSSQSLEQMDTTETPNPSVAETEEIDPASPSTVLAADVRRRAGNSGVMDEIDLGRTEITGNQELPKVLYIVPWQKSDPGDITGKPVNSLLDEVLAPVDRTEFLRRVDYYGELYDENE